MPRFSKFVVAILVVFCLWSPVLIAEEPEPEETGIVATVMGYLHDLVVIINQGVMLPPNGEPNAGG